MKSLFTRQIFQADFQPKRLSQATAFNAVTDILNKIGITDTEIEDLISKVPSGIADQYKSRLEECRNMGLTTAEGAACLYKLYQDIRGRESQTQTRAPAPTQAPKSSFPIVPVAIGGGILLALGIFFAVR